MKNWKKSTLVILLGLMLGMGSLMAQSNDRSKPGPADRNQPREAAGAPAGIMPGFSAYAMIRAVEKAPMKFAITVDLGNDKEGKPREIFKGDKEKEGFDKTVQNGQLVDLLSMMSVRGYEIKSAYAVTEGGSMVHYYVLASERGAGAQMNQGRTEKQQLTPEQKEKMKEEREKRRKEMEQPKN